MQDDESPEALLVNVPSVGWVPLDVHCSVLLECTTCLEIYNALLM